MEENENVNNTQQEEKGDDTEGKFGNSEASANFLVTIVSVGIVLALLFLFMFPALEDDANHEPSSILEDSKDGSDLLDRIFGE